ncbi:MAG: hypothetical protein MZV65_46900 [Chromatiales bacterium]|nr:hypothetical protein [Chromatiales bacterium]
MRTEARLQTRRHGRDVGPQAGRYGMKHVDGRWRRRDDQQARIAQARTRAVVQRGQTLRAAPARPARRATAGSITGRAREQRCGDTRAMAALAFAISLDGGT